MPTYQPDSLGSQLFQARMKAHDVLQEHLKQIILIASGTLTLTATFLGSVIGVKGENASWAWTLPVAWCCLGVSIAAAIWTIAVLLNNLDWPAIQDVAPPYTDYSYTAGARFGVHNLILLSVGTFSLGMLLLGVFAARNYELFLYRVKTEYTINSASEAVAKARDQLPSDANQSQVEVIKVELIKGVNETPPSDQVWHVQLQYESVAQMTPAESKTQPEPGKKQTRSGKRAQASAQEPVKETEKKENKTRIIDIFLDAKTGALMKVPK